MQQENDQKTIARLLDECAILIVELQFHPTKNVKKIAEGLGNVFEIQQDICKVRPDLEPEWVKKIETTGKQKGRVTHAPKMRKQLKRIKEKKRRENI